MMWRLWRGRMRSCSHRASVNDACATLVGSSLLLLFVSLTVDAVSRVADVSTLGSLATSDVAGDSEGESTDGSSIFVFATGSPPALSIWSRLAMALVLNLAFINR